jgi:hypothetical protein
MRLLLLAGLTTALAAAEGLPPGWDRTGTTARDDVVLEVWRKAGDPIGRVVLRNRTDREVRVGYRVAPDFSSAIHYVTRLDPRATVGLEEPIPVPIGNQVDPDIGITAVDRLPITESSGYVRMDEDVRDGVTAWIYRRADGGDRAYLVLRNAGAAAVEVTLRLSGLTERDSVRIDRVPGRTIRGDDGSLALEYHPVAQPYQEPVRVRIQAVGR